MCDVPPDLAHASAGPVVHPASRLVGAGAHSANLTGETEPAPRGSPSRGAPPGALHEQEVAAPRFAEVAVTLPVAGRFHYTIPAGLARRAQVGARVLVRFGARKVTGVVVRTDTAPPEGVAAVAISEVLDDEPSLSVELVELCSWIAEYYEAPPGEVLRAALPAGSGVAARVVYGLTAAGRAALSGEGGALPPRHRALLARLEGRALPAAGLASGARQQLEHLVARGWVEHGEQRDAARVRLRRERVVQLVGSVDVARDAVARAPKRRGVIEALASGAPVAISLLEQQSPGAKLAVRELARLGLVSVAERELPIAAASTGSQLAGTAPPVLTNEQQRAVDEITAVLRGAEHAVRAAAGCEGEGAAAVASRGAGGGDAEGVVEEITAVLGRAERAVAGRQGEGVAVMVARRAAVDDAEGAVETITSTPGSVERAEAGREGEGAAVVVARRAGVGNAEGAVETITSTPGSVERAVACREGEGAAAVAPRGAGGGDVEGVVEEITAVLGGAERAVAGREGEGAAGGGARRAGGGDPEGAVEKLTATPGSVERAVRDVAGREGEGAAGVVARRAGGDDAEGGVETITATAGSVERAVRDAAGPDGVAAMAVDARRGEATGPALGATIAGGAAASAGASRRAAAPFLLHGVTGSGKTEVYLQVIAAALAAGRTALVLVPEISLTPQLAARFRARFGDLVAILHSGLSETARLGEWSRLRRGDARIAVGARSAVFAPLAGLGVIVVDEEHDGSFKQDEGVRYHARDVALVRAQRAGAVCVLGSATPSLETAAHAERGAYRKLTLTQRPTARPMPAVEIVDLRTYMPDGEAMLSAPLRAAIGEALAAGDQTILFLNRRGFATFVLCRGCGHAFRCPHCSVSLTYHRHSDRLACHYCGFAQRVPEVCPSCSATGTIERKGLGTEKVADAIAAAFPAARVARLDRDVASGAKVEAVLGRVARREVDVLVGTQMVTKGHDFPGVTLVGVLCADAGLNLPDFRASERTFQLLAQVAGRAGRGERPGRVMIQTYRPSAPAVVAAAAHDYAGFFAAESAERAELGYPPHGRLVAVRIDGPDAQEVAGVAHRLAQAAMAVARRADLSGPVEVRGPVPAPLERLRNRTRWQVWLRSADRHALRRVARSVLAVEVASTVRVGLDVDPISAM